MRPDRDDHLGIVLHIERLIGELSLTFVPYGTKNVFIGSNPDAALVGKPTPVAIICFDIPDYEYDAEIIAIGSFIENYFPIWMEIYFMPTESATEQDFLNAFTQYVGVCIGIELGGGAINPISSLLV